VPNVAARSPVGDPVAAGKLRAQGGILKKLDPHAVRVRQPGLPGLVAAQSLVGDVDSPAPDMGDGVVDAGDFETEMVDAVAIGIFGFRFQEDLKIAAPAGAEVEAVSRILSGEVEDDLHAQHVSIEIAGPREVIGEDADMGELLRFDLGQLASPRRNGCIARREPTAVSLMTGGSRPMRAETSGQRPASRVGRAGLTLRRGVHSSVRWTRCCIA
jgi:hypothetical protein